MTVGRASSACAASGLQRTANYQELKKAIEARASPRIGHSQNKHAMPFGRAHFGQSLACRTVRSSREPRSNSPLISNLPTSL